MTNAQIINEINYKKAVLLLRKILQAGMITEEQYNLIDQLNRDTFSPELKKIYAESN